MNFPAIPQRQPAEHIQQNHWNNNRGQDTWQDVGPRRRYPAEQPFIQYVPRQGWWQGGRKLRHFKPKYYWTRPHDGKRPGAWGRLKDVLTSEGADVFVTINGDKRTLMRDRPQKWQWSGWPEDSAHRQERREFDPDAIEAEFMDPMEASWTKSSSRNGARYNFRTRKYEPQQWSWGANPQSVWRDAQWKPGARRSDNNPYSHQTADGAWWTRVPQMAGFFPGGRPRR